MNWTSYIFALGTGVALGVPCRPAPTQVVTLQPRNPADVAGMGVNLGDVDRDGIADVGVFFSRIGVGYVRVFSGKSFKVIRDVDVRGLRPWGWGVWSLGDINSDGHADFASKVAVPNVSKQFEVILYSGKNGSVLRNHTWRDAGVWAKTGFGMDVAGGFDVDKDGVPDVAISAFLQAVGKTNNGVVMVFSGKDGTMIRRIDGTHSGARLGQRLSFAGDLNGDGYADLLVAGMQSTAKKDILRVISGKDGSYLWTVVNPLLSATLPCPRPIADMDGDQLPDVGHGGPWLGSMSLGGAVIYSGKTGSVIRAIRNPLGRRPTYAGYRPIPLHDLNGDGRPEVAIDVSIANSGHPRIAYGIFSTATGAPLHTIVNPPSGRIVLEPLPDFDLDGRQELFTSGGLPSTAHVLSIGVGSTGTFGQGCRGTMGVPSLSLSNAPVIDQKFAVRVANLLRLRPAVLIFGFSTERWRGTRLPIDLAGAGMPGCQLFVSIDAQYLATPLGSAHSFPFSVPNDPRLIGMRFYNQAYALDRRANFAGLVVSNAAHAIVGLF